MTRRQLRNRFRAARRGLTASDQRAHAKAITRHVLNSGLLLAGRRVAAYCANDGEPSLWPLILELYARDRIIALPVVGGPGRMTFHRYRPGDRLLLNRYGIPEPAAGAPRFDGRGLDVVFVPLVAFDGNGNRLGMGAGCYDRYLGAIPAALQPRLVGVAHEVQRSTEPLPEAAWDVRLHAVVTERGWQRFR